MNDFSAALEAFEREQAAEGVAVEAYGDKVVSGTVIKHTDKHLVVDVGLKSEGLVPIEQVVDHTGAVKFNAGDVIEVVIGREEPEGGYLVSYEKAQRLRVWDVIEKAANDKTPVMGTVVSRVKGGLTVDIGMKAFLPGSQVEIGLVNNLDGYLGQQIEVLVIKLDKKRGSVVVSRKEVLEEKQIAKRSTKPGQLGFEKARLREIGELMPKYANESIRYTLEALEGKGDDELLALLKQSWGYLPDQLLIVIGELVTDEGVTAEGKARSYFRLKMLKSPNDFRTLEYPVDAGGISHTVFVPARDGKNLVRDWPGAVYFKARVELSPERERGRHRNPLELQVVPNTIEVLEELPFELPNINAVNGKSLLEKSIVDFYLDKNKAKLEANSEAVRAAQEQEQGRLDASLAQLQSAEKQIDEQLARNTSSLHEILGQLDAQQTLLTALIDDYQTKKDVMNSHLARLNDFVRSKADTLLRLGFIDQSDMRAILGEPQSPDAVNSYDFEQDFNLDDGAAIKHIQAFLHAKGIYYKQALLKDFLALLRTQDLIVLAGDSGSGKTNLVKSFAQATGAKAIIIPVKPNWTSTEDLLGYYNPLEKRYITTQFLDALIDAANNPQVPYLICLDEMNLARVEYYFADFLSLLEERSKQPEIFLYSDTEASHVQHEYDTFLKLVDEVAGSGTLSRGDFSELLKDESANGRLHRLCGFRDGESLLNYHSRLRRLLAGLVRTPSSITLPANVRFIGAINVDETTHYLSPKILDRAHVIRFTNPLLFDWQAFERELEPQDRNLSMPVRLQAAHMGERAPYPEFDRNDAFVGVLVDLARDYLSKLGIEFGFRTVRQARNYALESRRLGIDEGMVLNNFVLHKVLPKLMLDGSKKVSEGVTRKDVLYCLRAFLERRFETLEGITGEDSCIAEMDNLMRNAEANDWAVNYWAR